MHGRKALLKEFIDSQGEFIPKDLEDFDLFLKLFLADGTDFLPKDKYFEFLDKTIFGDARRQKANAINAISSSVILAAYSLNPYQLKNNYYALFEGWACLAGSIVRYAHKGSLERRDWLDSYNLAFNEIIRNLSMLKEEMFQREDFLEGDWRGDGGLIYRMRATIVLGVLATLMTHLEHAGQKHEKEEKMISLMKKNLPVLCFWGESAFPYFFSIIKYLEMNGEGSAAQSVLSNIFLEIININFPRKENGIPNVYYSASALLEVIVKINGGDIDFKGFAGNSYILGAMMLMMARRSQRKILEENWRKITYVQMNEFMPDHPEDMFTWRTKEGTNYSEFPKMTQSWVELQKEAMNFDGAPQLLTERLDLLRFFILTCPHRATKLIIGLLDSSIKP